MGLGLLKYVTLLKKHNGIIDRIEIVNKNSQKKEYEAFSFLDDSLKLKKSKFHIYGSADGMGTSTSRVLATAKSISEALERWAYWHLKENNPKAAYLDINSSSDGFSCFPGLTAKSAERRSLCEAVERWTIAAFAAGNLAPEHFQTTPHGHSTLSFPIFFGVTTIIICAYDNETGLNYYGFGADFTPKGACEHASREASRNLAVLINAVKSKKCSPEQLFLIGKQNNFYFPEQRLSYFATDAGKRKFDLLLQQRSQNITPVIKFNKELIGPWSEYGRVWRCVLGPVDLLRNDQSASDFFCF